MKNNKGFTLIELLAAITLLSVLSVLTIPMIIKRIDEVKDKGNEISQNGIIDGANLYYKENRYYITWNSIDTQKEYKCISFQELIDNGFFSRENIQDNYGDIKENYNKINNYKVKYIQNKNTKSLLETKIVNVLNNPTECS